MIITRTPYRISFFGGGSDYEEWYSKHGGAVLSTTIDRYCYISLRKMPPFLGSKYLLIGVLTIASAELIRVASTFL